MKVAREKQNLQRTQTFLLDDIGETVDNRVRWKINLYSCMYTYIMKKKLDVNRLKGVLV